MRDVRKLDLSMLRVLDALLQERSVTKVANRLGLTQSAISGLLARLRESLEDQLFVRGQRGMVPTLRATELGPAVKRVLAGVEELMQPPTFNPALASFTLALTASDYAVNVLAPSFVSKLRADAPGVRMVVRPLTEMIYHDLETGHTDIALAVQIAERTCRVHELFRDSFVCVMREDHPAAMKPLSLDLFCSLDHVLVAPDGTFNGRTDEALAEIGRRRRVALSVGSFLVLPGLLRASDMIAVIPERLVRDAPGLVRRPPPLPVSGFTLYALWHESTHSDPARAWVRSLLFEAAAMLTIPAEN